MDKPIWVLNPEIKKFYRIPETDLEIARKQEKGKLIKYYHSKTIGILITIKPGQFSPKKYLSLNQKLSLANKIKSRLEKKGKLCYIFVFDSLDVNEFENYPFIDVWVNTACPRIKDKRIINLRDIPL